MESKGPRFLVRVSPDKAHLSGQIIATSHNPTPDGGLAREFLYFREIQVGEIL